jgi:hypothetical protein
MAESNFQKTLRALKLKAAANVSGIDIIDQQTSKKDFIHVWDITGIAYLIIGSAFFIFALFVAYSVFSIESTLDDARNSTDIITVRQSKPITEFNVHYTCLPLVAVTPNGITLQVASPNGYPDGTYVTFSNITEFAINGGFAPSPDSRVYLNFGTSTHFLTRGEGMLYMAYNNQWYGVRGWNILFQNGNGGQYF